MRTIFSILVGLLFIGCGNDFISKVKPKIKPNVEEKSIITTIDNDNNESFEGNYTLEAGYYLFSDNSSIRTPILASSLVIEKLDDDDYGYYFTLKKSKNSNMIITPYSGILHKQGDDFFQKLIYTVDMKKDDNSSDSNISDENLTEAMAEKSIEESNVNLTTEIKDKVNVTKVGDTLKIDMKIPNEKNARISITWRKTGTLEQTKELKEAEHDYKKLFKERFEKYFKFDD